MIVRKAGGFGLSMERALELTVGQINWLLDPGEGDSPAEIEQRMIDKAFSVLNGLQDGVGALRGVPVSEVMAMWPEPVDAGELAFWISEFIRCTEDQ